MTTVNEANAVNLLVRWALSLRDGLGRRPDRPAAVEAAAFLADRAHARLQAGVTAAEVRQAARRREAASTVTDLEWAEATLEDIAAILAGPAPTLAKVAAVLREAGIPAPDNPGRRP